MKEFFDRIKAENPVFFKNMIFVFSVIGVAAMALLAFGVFDSPWYTNKLTNIIVFCGGVILTSQTTKRDKNDNQG